VINSRRMRWAVHVARMGQTKLHTIFYSEKLEGRVGLRHPGIDERIILKWTLEK
jgi:hypothetical protein